MLMLNEIQVFKFYGVKSDNLVSEFQFVSLLDQFQDTIFLKEQFAKSVDSFSSLRLYQHVLVWSQILTFSGNVLGPENEDGCLLSFLILEKFEFECALHVSHYAILSCCFMNSSKRWKPFIFFCQLHNHFNYNIVNWE